MATPLKFVRPTLSARPLAWFRLRFRASEIWFVGLAILVGAAAGLLTVALSFLAHTAQAHLFGFTENERLSSLARLPIRSLVWLPFGGVLLGLVGLALRRWRPKHLVDVVEANALYGGQLSFRDSVIVCLQTVLSNGFGASVGLEAAYAQAGGAVASWAGGRLNLRRQDQRTLVGAGAGAAIAAAFGAPLAGAFYAFEIVIGTYAPSMIAPVAAATLTSVMVAGMAGAAPYSITIASVGAPQPLAYLIFSLLGAVCAAFGVLVMQLTAVSDRVMRWIDPPLWARPMIGGVLLAGLAFLSPQVLSSGHGALHADIAERLGLAAIGLLLLLKTTASVVSLSFGFRGGLFFASLFLGSLLGEAFAQGADWVSQVTGWPVMVSPENAALVGMGALAVAIVGGPLTMSFLVLEATRDFGIAAATLAASLIASTLVRERFGYSFSTWRLHLRGETIRSARDVGWMRALTAGRMMRPDVPSAQAAVTITAFRHHFPLGSATRVVLTGEEGRYAGIVQVAQAYVEGLDLDKPIGSLAQAREVSLPPDANIEQIMLAFDETETDELAVVDEHGKVLGLVTEGFVSRRYARELEKIQLGLFGERRKEQG